MIVHYQFYALMYLCVRNNFINVPDGSVVNYLFKFFSDYLGNGIIMVLVPFFPVFPISIPLNTFGFFYVPFSLILLSYQLTMLATLIIIQMLEWKLTGEWLKFLSRLSLRIKMYNLTTMLSVSIIMPWLYLPYDAYAVSITYYSLTVIWS